MKSRKEIILELTPLLDVILIMMFYILMQNSIASKQEQDKATEQIQQIESQYQAQLDEAESKQAEALSELDELKKDKDELKDKLAAANAKLEAEDAFSEYAIIVSVTIVKAEDGYRKMHILYGERDESFNYGWDDMKYAENALRNQLDNIVKDKDADQPVFLVFCYDEDDVYKQDYELVQKAFIETKGEHIYMKYKEEMDYE